MHRGIYILLLGLVLACGTEETTKKKTDLQQMNPGQEMGCDSSASAALNVLVTSASSSLQVYAFDGSEYLPLEMMGPQSSETTYAGVWERTGTYRILFYEYGRFAGSAENVQVVKEGCHVTGRIIRVQRVSGTYQAISIQ